jgi:predicted ArsR family transcriptional regulator
MIDFDRLDRVIHEKGRLSIVSLLATKPDWSFGDLGAELKMSDGNLITHLRTLTKANYVTVEKKSEGSGRPKSFYSMTESGSQAFNDYIAILEQIVSNTKN